MTIRSIDLIYETTCPNAAKARALLQDAVDGMGLGNTWSEWNRSSTDFPERFEAFGSPTILVNGIDVAGESGSADADSCRVYLDDGQIRGVPTLAQVTSALLEAASSES